MAKQEVDKLEGQLVGLVVAQGVLAILFGIAALFWPGATFVLMVSLFGIFVLVWGVVALIRSLLSIGRSGTWWLELIFALLAVGLGVYLLRNPGVAVGTFVLLVGFTFIIRGLVDFVQGVFGKAEEIGRSRALHIVLAVIGILAGILVLANPVSGALAFVWVVGLYAILEGVVFIVMAVKAHNELA